MKKLVSDEIESLVPYPPGKPIEEVERELGIKGSIKLASNENPLGPSPKAVAAIADALKNLNRYPDGGCYYLKEKCRASRCSAHTGQFLSEHLSREPIAATIFRGPYMQVLW